MVLTISRPFLLWLKLTSICFLTLFANIHHWSLHQLDIKNTFLQGILNEEFMWSNHLVVLLKKSLDKFVISRSLYIDWSRAWIEWFASVVQEFGLRRSHKDHSIFFRLHQRKWILLHVYLDDIVISGDDAQEINKLKLYL